MFKTVIVEGLPGAGKTVFSRELSHQLGGDTLHIQESDERSGNTYLPNYYADPRRWAFTMQIHLLQIRFRSHLCAQYHTMARRGHAVLDRSYYGDVAFAEVQRRWEYMTAAEFETYSAIYHNMTAFVLYPDVCVHLDVSPEVALRRIQRRMQEQESRSCEQRIDMNYLREVHDATSTVVRALQHHGTQIVELQWNCDRATPSSREDVVAQVASAVQQCEVRREFADIHKRLV